jgi:hypothetical protein
MNLEDSQVHEAALMFGCPVAQCTIKEDIQPLVDKIVKRITRWSGRDLCLLRLS